MNPTQDYSTDPRITQITQATRNGKVVYHLRFNPNSHRQQSHETGQTLTWGTCFTMSDYRKMLAHWEDSASLSPDDVQHVRVDFCIDCTDEAQAESFKKYCDLMIACFKSKHRISEKHDYYGATQMTLRPKNNKAKHGEYELELYCKSIQQENNGAEWRMEIRHMEGKSKRRKLLAPEERLRKMQEELQTLPAYYEQTLAQLNTALLQEYEKGKKESRNALKRNSFIYLHRDKFFSRHQIEEFISSTGEVKDYVKSADNYLYRHVHDTILKNRLADFIASVTDAIEKYLMDEGVFGEVIDIIEPGKGS